MTVQNALEEMKERAFAPAFQKYLFDTYKVLAQTDFSEEEKDYTAAEDYFTTTLEQSENEILSQIKTNYEAKLRYASRYAFNAGLYSGFVQHFSNQDLVVDGLKSISCRLSLRCPVCSAILCFCRCMTKTRSLSNSSRLMVMKSDESI